MYSFKVKIIVFFFIGFGIIDFITGSMWWSLKLCFQSVIFPLSLWNPIRLPPITILLLGLTIYSSIKILNLENDKAFKVGAVIVGFDVLKLYFDTVFMLNFNILPYIGYYLEILALIMFSIFSIILFKYRETIWVVKKSIKAR